MTCLKDGSKALIMSDEDGRIRIGLAKNESELFQNKSAFSGIKYFNNKGDLIWEKNLRK
jgi:hypothetical protein